MSPLTKDRIDIVKHWPWFTVYQAAMLFTGEEPVDASDMARILNEQKNETYYTLCRELLLDIKRAVISPNCIIPKERIKWGESLKNAPNSNGEIDEIDFSETDYCRYRLYIETTKMTVTKSNLEDLEEKQLKKWDVIRNKTLDPYKTKISKEGLVKWAYENEYYPPFLMDSIEELKREKEGLSKPKKRPVQIHKEECRKIAKKLWKDDPSITIVDMANRDEIKDIWKGRIYKGEEDDYKEVTIRNWIKEYCPNRSPGRRPKKRD